MNREDLPEWRNLILDGETGWPYIYPVYSENYNLACKMREIWDDSPFKNTMSFVEFLIKTVGE
jgi:hypothetical protein